MDNRGRVDTILENKIGRIHFSHPKANCLPRHSLTQLANAIRQLSDSAEVNVIALSSDGEGAFSAGASFQEFERISSADEGEAFFLGFSEVLLAMKSSRKLIVSRAQGKAVGGGVGLLAGSDYVFAAAGAAVRLSEFELGIGPFVVGPAIERKIGLAAFSALALDCEWRDAAWAERQGLFSKVFANLPELNIAFEAFLSKMANSSLDASSQLREVFWQGTEHWSTLLPQRAKTSGALLAKRLQTVGSSQKK